MKIHDRIIRANVKLQIDRNKIILKGNNNNKG